MTKEMPVPEARAEAVSGLQPVSRRIALHGLSAEIESPRRLNRFLNILLDSYPAECDSSPATFSVKAVPDPENPAIYSVVSGNHRYPEAEAGGRVALRVEWVVISEFVQTWSQFVHIHSGVVATTERSALLVGRSGSGKSTTTVALALEGLSLYTDDVALIDPETLKPYCVPRPVKLDHISRRMLKPLGLTIPRNGRIGESVRRSLLPGLPSLTEGGPRLTSAVFFGSGRQERPVLRKISSAEAALRLIMQSASEKLDETGPTEGAISVVNAVECFELIPGDLQSTVELLKKLLESG